MASSPKNADQEFLRALATADVITAVDSSSGEEYVVFGPAALRDIAAITMNVTVDVDSGELEELLKIIRILRRRDETSRPRRIDERRSLN